MTHATRSRVDKRTDITKQFRSVLNLVEYNGRLNLVKKGTWITAHSLLSVMVFEQHIAGVGKQLAQQGGFSCTTWPGYDNRWELPRCVEKDRCQLPGNISHMRNIN